MQSLCNWLIIATGMLHDDPCFTLYGLELLCQSRQILGGVAYVEGQLYDLAKGTKNAMCFACWWKTT